MSNNGTPAIKVSLYNGCVTHDDNPGKVVDINSIVTRIKVGSDGLRATTERLNELFVSDRDLYKVEKEKIDCVTWSGTFPPNECIGDSMIQHSGYVVLDIDDDIDLATVRDHLSNHPNVRFAFLSPSGRGYKPLVKVDPIPQNKVEHEVAFNAVIAVFSEYASDKDLVKQRNPNRFCFLAYDPEPISNASSVPVSWEMPENPPVPEASPAPETEYDPPTVAEAEVTLRKLPNDVKYSRWVEIGMAIKSAGLPLSVFENWSGSQRKRSTGEWLEVDMEKKWASFKKSGVSWGSVVHWANPNPNPKPKKDKDSGSSPAEIPKTVGGLSVVMLSEENGVVMAKPRHVVSDDVATYLWRNEKIYRRGIFLGTLRRGEDAPVFVRSEIPSIGGDISRSCALMRHSKVGVPSTVANPPGWLCADILHNQAVDKVREIRVVVSHPFYNGETLVTAEGYDSGTQTYLDSSFDVEMGEHTAESDLVLWKDLLQDFPFEDNSDFENAIAFALTLIVRQGLKVGEEVPLFNVTAAREGVGKSLLACTLCSVLMGYNMATDDLSSNREEIEKAVGGILLSAREAVVFDNVDSDRPLDSGLLASIITQPKRSIRPLGTSQLALIENCATFCCTGSNVEVKPELAKRMVAVRLSDPGIPEKDRTVKIEGLQDYVLEHRDQYLFALVRMVQRWIDADKPEAKNTHRMRQWSRVVRGIMLANGFGGQFLENADAVMLSASPDYTIWNNAFKEIVLILGEQATGGWTAKEVFQILSFEKEVYAHELDKESNGGKSFTRSAQGRGLLNELIGHQANDQARRVKLGQLLRNKMGAVYGGYKLIDTHKSYGGAKIYALEGVADDGESD